MIGAEKSVTLSQTADDFWEADHVEWQANYSVYWWVTAEELAEIGKSGCDDEWVQSYYPNAFSTGDGGCALNYDASEWFPFMQLERSEDGVWAMWNGRAWWSYEICASTSTLELRGIERGGEPVDPDWGPLPYVWTFAR